MSIIKQIFETAGVIIIFGVASFILLVGFLGDALFPDENLIGIMQELSTIVTSFKRG